jgi:hypothetical protein
MAPVADWLPALQGFNGQPVQCRGMNDHLKPRHGSLPRDRRIGRRTGWRGSMGATPSREQTCDGRGFRKKHGLYQWVERASRRSAAIATADGEI